MSVDPSHLEQIGESFVASTGKQTSAGTIITGLAVFNPVGSGKTFYVYSAKGDTAATNFHQLNFVTSDPALGTPVTAVNSKAGSAIASVAVCSMANTVVVPAGTAHEFFQAVGNQETQVLDTSETHVVPPGNGVVLYMGTATNNWIATIKWKEI